MPDSRDYSFPTLENFPQMESGVTRNFGNEAQHEPSWEPQNDSLGDGWIPSAIEGLSGDTSSIQKSSLSSDSAHAMGEARRVSLFLENMQPETANKVTSMLLKSNVDLKMTMTIQ